MKNNSNVYKSSQEQIAERYGLDEAMTEQFVQLARTMRAGNPLSDYMQYPEVQFDAFIEMTPEEREHYLAPVIGSCAMEACCIKEELLL